RRGDRHPVGADGGRVRERAPRTEALRPRRPDRLRRRLEHPPPHRGSRALERRDDRGRAAAREGGLTTMTKVLAISGSLRRDSYNTNLLRNAVGLFGDDVEVEILDGLKDVPPYDEDDDRDGAPESVQNLRAAFAGADAVLIATPEYNSSIPGHLKNALDWVSRPLAENPL